MRRPLVGSLLGLLVGAALGSALACCVYVIEQSNQPTVGWTSYPTLANPTGPVLWQGVNSSGPLTSLLFRGVLFGGGFGSVVGTLSGGTAAIVRAVGQAKTG